MAKLVEYTEAIDLDSSFLKKVYFVPTTTAADRGQIYVEFKAGNIAGYDGIPKFVFDAFAKAESAGSHYSSNLKNNWYGTLSGDVELVYTGAAEKGNTLATVKEEEFVVEWELVQTGKTVIKATDGRDAAKVFGDRYNISQNGRTAKYKVTRVVRPEQEVPFE